MLVTGTAAQLKSNKSFQVNFHGFMPLLLLFFGLSLPHLINLASSLSEVFGYVTTA